jgi:uncharacterized protein (DUF302 family)
VCVFDWSDESHHGSGLVLPCRFMASDGSTKIKTMMPSPFMKEIQAGDLQNLSLILDYTCNKIKDHM